MGAHRYPPVSNRPHGKRRVVDGPEGVFRVGCRQAKSGPIEPGGRIGHALTTGSKTRWPIPPARSAFTAIAGSASPDAAASPWSKTAASPGSNPIPRTRPARRSAPRAAPRRNSSIIRERLTHPLRRTRPKGDPDPGWERISWDEALDLTAAAMRRVAERHGPEAVAFTISSPSTTAIGNSTGFVRRLMNAFGTPNASHHPRHLRLGPRLRHPLHLWRRQRRHRRRRWRDAGHRQQRRSDPVGLQPELHPPHPCDRRRRGAEARHAADRHRPAPCRASPARPICGSGCGPAPTARSPSASPM